MKVTISDGQDVHGVLATGDETKFKTGSKGYHAQGKLEIDGKRYQCNILLVEVGSKPAKATK